MPGTIVGTKDTNVIKRDKNPLWSFNVIKETGNKLSGKI